MQGSVWTFVSATFLLLSFLWNSICLGLHKRSCIFNAFKNEILCPNSFILLRSIYYRVNLIVWRTIRVNKIHYNNLLFPEKCINIIFYLEDKYPVLSWKTKNWLKIYSTRRRNYFKTQKLDSNESGKYQDQRL